MRLSATTTAERELILATIHEFVAASTARGNVVRRSNCMNFGHSLTLKKLQSQIARLESKFSRSTKKCAKHFKAVSTPDFNRFVEILNY